MILYDVYFTDGTCDRRASLYGLKDCVAVCANAARERFVFTLLGARIPDGYLVWSDYVSPECRAMAERFGFEFKEARV